MESTKTSSSFTKWKPIEWMLALLFLVAPFYHHPNIGGTGLRIPNNIIVWMLANIIGWYSLYLFSKRAKLTLPRYFRYIYAFPILATMSGFISGVENPIEWVFRLLFIWYGLLFFIGLFQHKLSNGRIDRILFIIVLSALIQACVGIIQISASGSIPYWILKSEILTPFGMFQQINNQATYQVTAFIIAIFLITRPYITAGSAWKKILVLGFFSSSAFIISYAGSRIGVLSILISLPFALAGRWQYFKKNKSLAVATLLFVIMGVVMGATGTGLGKLTDKTAHITDGYSASVRLVIYAVSFDLIKKKPWFGHGLGSFKHKWQFEKANFYQSHPDAKATELTKMYVTHPHNELIFWLIEGGIVALAGILILVAGILLSLKLNIKHRWGIYLALLLPILIHTQVELPFYSSALHWFLMLFLLFILMRVQAKEKCIVISKIALQSTRLIAVTMIITGSIFLAHSLRASYELGNNNIWRSAVANTNPYFSDIAESIRMKSMFLIIDRETKTDGLQKFIDWAEHFLLIEPSSQMFIYLAMAYRNLNKTEDMCRVIKLGESIYPSVPDLMSGVKYCRERNPA